MGLMNTFGADLVTLIDGTTGGAVGGGTVSNPTVVTGNVAHDAADSGNPVKVGGIYRVTPDAADDGDRVDLPLGLYGRVWSGMGKVSGLLDGRNTVVWANGDDDSGGALNVLAVQAFGYNGVTSDAARGDTNGLVTQKGLSSTAWSYANGATGILSNTTVAVMIKAAAGAGVRNYLDSLQINTTAFGASSPIAIRDGASGTILFALNVPTAGFLNPINILFETPLKGTANTLLEVVTTTANITGTAWVNAQGHTGI